MDSIVEEHARELGVRTPYSFAQIRDAIIAVEAPRRALGQPEIPPDAWVAVMEPCIRMVVHLGSEMPLAEAFGTVLHEYA